MRKVIFVTKNSFSHFFGTPCRELTSSIGKKHLQLSLPSQFRQMVLLNIRGTAGRMARPQQTRIALDQLRIEDELFLSQLVKLRCLHTCVLAEKLDSRKVSWLHTSAQYSILKHRWMLDFNWKPSYPRNCTRELWSEMCRVFGRLGTSNRIGSQNQYICLYWTLESIKG